MTTGWRMSAEDERAVSVALGGMVRKGLVAGGVERDDLRQEMALAIWSAGEQDPALKTTIARRAGIDFVRKIRGRPGSARNTASHSMVRPDDDEAHALLLDSQQSGDDPAMWAEIAQQIERVMAPPNPAPVVRHVGAPDPRSLPTVLGPPPAMIPPPRSAWAAVYDSLHADGGAGKVMTREQAEAFAAWARGHKLKITRRRLQGEYAGMYGVWRCQS